MRLADELHEGTLVVLPEAGQLARGRVLAARQLQSHLETKIIVWLPLCNIAINERDDSPKIRLPNLEIMKDNYRVASNIPAKFRESLTKCSAAHPKIALGRNITASHPEIWQECFYTTQHQDCSRHRNFDSATTETDTVSVSLDTHEVSLV